MNRNLNMIDSDPHPFISLLIPSKGKKVLSRITRHFSDQRMLTMLTLLVACFHQLDVVTQSPILDHPQETRERSEAERQTQAFLGSALQSILPVVAKANLRLVTGLLGLLLDRSDVVVVAQTRVNLSQPLSSILAYFLPAWTCASYFVPKPCRGNQAKYERSCGGS